MLIHDHPHRSLAHLLRVPVWSCHRSILSRNGASRKPGAVHRLLSAHSFELHGPGGLESCTRTTGGQSLAASWLTRRPSTYNWLRGPAITEIDSAPIRSGRRLIAEPVSSVCLRVSQRPRRMGIR